MTRTWTKPGRLGATLYGGAAIIVGLLLAAISRLRIAKHRGRRAAAEALPEGPIIIVSNHASYADGLLLALVCRRLGRSVRLLATAGVFRAPVIGWLATRLGFIPVERGSSSASDALEPAVQALAAGEAVGIFPEGRTTRDPDHWPERAKTGAVRLALRTGAPIVPIGMVGTHRVLARGRTLRSIFVGLVRRPEVRTQVGSLIQLRELASGDAPDREEVRRLADYVMEQIIDLVEALRQEDAPHPRGVDPG